MAGLFGKSVDAVINKMDVDHIVQKINVDELVNRIDWNRVIDKVDLDHQISRVNIDRVVDRIDFEKIIDKSNIEAIVARSSSGIFLQFVDLIRIKVVASDLFVQRLARGRCCHWHDNLPASPERRRIHNCGSSSTMGSYASAASATINTTTTARDRQRSARERAAARILQVQGGFSGIVSRAASWLLDELVIVGTFGLGSLCAEGIYRLVKGNGDEGFHLQNALLATILYALWGVHYRVICLLLTRRTLGMLVLGLKLVSAKHGKRPSATQIILRQLLQPWLAIFFFIGGPALFLAWQRQDGRFIHDLLTGTGYVYSWDVRMAKMRLARTDDSVFDDVADLDGMDIAVTV